MSLWLHRHCTPTLALSLAGWRWGWTPLRRDGTVTVAGAAQCQTFQQRGKEQEPG